MGKADLSALLRGDGEVMYTIADWILAGWTMAELAEKATTEGWTATQVIDWCVDHADDEVQKAEVLDLPGYDEMIDEIAIAISGCDKVTK